MMANPLIMLGILWCRDQELNQGHGDFQSPALPTELSRQKRFGKITKNCCQVKINFKLSRLFV
jgi:hypothetical protein